MTTFSRSRSRRQTRFPLATVATYGPNTTLATKLVVAVIEGPDDRNPSVTRTWTTEGADIRHDPSIAAEVASFVRQHHVRDTAASDRIIGCPHQEGIDYPMGRTCPRCPFWADIDRFTQEPLTTPAPTMTPAEILAALSSDEPIPPYGALESADGHRALLIEPLLHAIDLGLAAPSSASPGEAILFDYALYLLAKWRETSAYPYVIRWLSLRGEGPFDIAGDVVTQDGGQILAAVCDGDLEPIKALVLDRGANEYARDAGLKALALLAAWLEVPREPVVSFFLWLAREGLEREPSHVWNGLAANSADIEALPLFPELRRAYADGLIAPGFMAPSELDDVEAAPPGSVLEETREQYAPIDDVVDATAWWPSFSDVPEPVAAIEPYRAPPKVGRNEPCPCDSGKKFKKCCGG